MPLHRLLTVFTIFFSVTLCAASGTEEVISKHLDRDGMEFFFVKKCGWQTMSSRFDEMLYHSLWISRLTPEEKEQTLTKITRWKLFRDLLGLGIGALARNKTAGKGLLGKADESEGECGKYEKRCQKGNRKIT